MRPRSGWPGAIAASTTSAVTLGSTCWPMIRQSRSRWRMRSRSRDCGPSDASADQAQEDGMLRMAMARMALISGADALTIRWPENGGNARAYPTYDDRVEGARGTPDEAGERADECSQETVTTPAPTGREL